MGYQNVRPPKNGPFHVAPHWCPELDPQPVEHWSVQIFRDVQQELMPMISLKIAGDPSGQEADGAKGSIFCILGWLKQDQNAQPLMGPSHEGPLMTRCQVNVILERQSGFFVKQAEHYDCKIQKWGTFFCLNQEMEWGTHEEYRIIDQYMVSENTYIDGGI